MLTRDVVIFGGGSAGLWLLDELSRRGYSAMLLERHALGAGQTVASQGIIHGGLKYTLQGMLTGSAAAIREMPRIWRACLAGQQEPDLSATRIRSQCCYLWRTDSVASRLGMIGARFGLRVAPKSLAKHERPSVFAQCPGTVAQLDEQVIATDSFIAALAQRNADRIFKIDADQSLSFETREPGQVTRLELAHPQLGGVLKVQARRYLFTAGAGNAALRELVGLAQPRQQLRPLHMLMVRGRLPILFGHCVDGAKTRVTITSDGTSRGDVVWQVGGQLAEQGVEQSPEELISHGLQELKSVLPGIDFSESQWATYRASRAEILTESGTRPDTPQWVCEGNTITAWPTKLALVPELVQQLLAQLPQPDRNPADASGTQAVLGSWSRPSVALPPWELEQNWHSFHSQTASIRRSA